MNMLPVYLDYNASTPIDSQVIEAMLPLIETYCGNPSSSHVFGIRGREAIEQARSRVAEMLHCDRDEIVFTSGGSESNNYAIKGVATADRNRGNNIITSSIEHPSVTNVCRYLESQGTRVTYLGVDSYGRIDPQQVEAAITPQTILISVMHANNEVGSIEPIAKIAEIAHRRGILVHTDCAQSIGKIPVWMDELNVDLLSLAGHKIYAPIGIGALYIRKGTKLEKQIHGGDHEMNRRAGTENVPYIVGLGRACELITENLSAYREHMRNMRDELESGLKSRCGAIRINGHPEERLPNTSSVGFKGLKADRILAELKTVAASAGAACHSNQRSVSATLTAMQVPMEYALGTIRFSVGRMTTRSEIHRALDEISRVTQ